MKKNAFTGPDFLLGNKYARRLYRDFAEGLPIIDYHCHLPPAQIADDVRWENIAQVWLGGDHYKWRAMRSNGVPEKYCTGDATDREKFQKWAETMPSLVRNPLYDWTHLELARYFGIADRLLGPETADFIWRRCNERLAEPGFTSRGLMKKSGVVAVCTTDDPVDSLEHHGRIARDKSFRVKVLPTWRPDKGMAVENPKAFNEWTDRLAVAAGIGIRDFDDFMAALEKRHAFFHATGCRLSDHGLETAYSTDWKPGEIKAIFRKVRGGVRPLPAEILKFKAAMLYESGVMDHRRGWVQQFHLGALRNNNSRLFAALGPDTGFDSMGDLEIARPLAGLMDRLDRENRLARTILYNLNPRDNLLLVSLMGCFQDGSVPGKIQFGSAWWFLDNKSGMERQLDDLSQCGLLGRFIGMLTDSRSFLSYTRHEYFRRILCNMLGRDMETGAIPRDFRLVGSMVRGICFENAKAYFEFEG